MDTATRVQILKKTVCISDDANTFGKCMNPIIRLPTTVKIRTDWAVQPWNVTGLGERKTLLKNLPCVPIAHVEEYIYIYIYIYMFVCV